MSLGPSRVATTSCSAASSPASDVKRGPFYSLGTVHFAARVAREGRKTIAAGLGISTRTVSRFASGQAQPKMPIAARIDRWLKIPMLEWETTTRGEEIALEREALPTSSAAMRVREALAAKPGLSTTELRVCTKLSGDRLAAVLAELGDQVVSRDERRARTRSVRRHFLAGDGGHVDTQRFAPSASTRPGPARKVAREPRAHAAR